MRLSVKGQPPPMFNSWEHTGDKSRRRQTLNFHDFLLLNTLAPAYHAGFGYISNEQYADDETSPLTVGATAFPNIATADDDDDSGYQVMIDLEEAEKAAKECKLSHKTVIVRSGPRGERGWDSKPSLVKRTCFDNEELDIPEALNWYELPTRPGKSKDFVGPLSERPYIHVIDPYDEIELRSEEKDERLTIDDVLFACRGLCCGPDRSVGEFAVLSDDGSTLMLQAEIDNWST